MIAELLRLLGEGTLASSYGILLALITRRPAARFFGSRLAYLLWLAVPASCLASLAPPLGFDVSNLGPMSMPSMTGRLSTVLDSSGADWATMCFGAWGIGALLVCASLVHQQTRFIASFGVLSFVDGLYRAAHISGGPAVIGLFRPKIVLPIDFEIRYTSAEQHLIIDHERMHLQSGDLIVNAVVATARCIFWFNPLIYVAARQLRIDQEMACDALVMRNHPASRKLYARTMLKTQLAEAGLPIGCHWQSVHPLKERIMRLNQPFPRGIRRATGQLLIGTLIVAVAGGAWAVQSSVGNAAAHQTRRDYADSGFSVSADSSRQSENGVRYVGNVVIKIMNSSAVMAFHSDSAKALSENKVLLEGHVLFQSDGWRFQTEKVLVEQVSGLSTLKMDLALLTRDPPASSPN